MRPLRVIAALAFLCLASVATPAFAHPLGNFTINHLAEIKPYAGELRVKYVLDIAEIPTFQIMSGLAPNGTWTPAQMHAWAEGENAIVLAGLQITADGNPVALKALGTTVRTRPGAGGLPILYWTGAFSAPLESAKSHAISVVDNVYSDRRIGWKDIIVGTQTEPTHELVVYPSALIGTPQRVTTASFAVAPSGVITNVREVADAQPNTGATNSITRSTILSEMFSKREQTPLFILLTILAAFGLGALHAIEPGHGKALLAFTLVGARATTKQAAILAASLTFAHTIGVLLLGVALFFASSFISERIYPWITLVSGVAVAFIGARALARYIVTRRSAAHSHSHDGAHQHDHDHDHNHGHDHAHGHSHAIPGNQPLNFKAAVWAAMSGGVAPCPAAIVVLLAALRLHKIGYGVLLIVIFSLGLAAVLTGLGIGVVHGAAWLSKRSQFTTFVRYGPLASACVISVIGAIMVGQGFVQNGMASSVPLIAALTLAAVAGYGLFTKILSRRSPLPRDAALPPSRSSMEQATT
ncbi:MAG: hypothetical protein M3M96_00865 [Candidatus Eremiobacteraeota bacterium]|nr:hypothetical protein [Candidatus Eremiobacteraeota bacterium]